MHNPHPQTHVMEGAIREDSVTPTELFSWLQPACRPDERLCVVDMRGNDAFYEGHILKATRVDDDSFALLRGKATCVLYFSGSESKLRHDDGVRRYSTVGVCLFILEGGYEAFMREFPFMCVGTESTRIEYGLAVLPYPAAIVPGLYLGSALDATSNEVLSTLGIKAICTVAGEYVDDPWRADMDVLRLDVADEEGEDLLPHLRTAVRWIATRVRAYEESIQTGGPAGATLVHCAAGRSRSAAVCIAYLISFIRALKIYHESEDENGAGNACASIGDGQTCTSSAAEALVE